MVSLNAANRFQEALAPRRSYWTGRFDKCPGFLLSEQPDLVDPTFFLLSYIEFYYGASEPSLSYAGLQKLYERCHQAWTRFYWQKETHSNRIGVFPFPLFCSYLCLPYFFFFLFIFCRASDAATRRILQTTRLPCLIAPRLIQRNEIPEFAEM